MLSLGYYLQIIVFPTWRAIFIPTNSNRTQYIVLYFQDIESKNGGADNAAKLATAITDANGFYRVSGLPEQLCFVSNQNQWQELGVVCRAVVPQSGKVSRLDFGGPVRVRGRIVLAGQPLANTKLQISLVDAPYLTTYQNFAMTDGEGGFSFYGVPKGRWAIHYQHAEGRSLTWLQAATINVASTELDLGAVQPYEGTVTVTVSVEHEDVNATWGLSGLHIQTGTGMRGRSVGEVASPAAPGQPYVVRHVPAGAHKIVLSRTDFVRLYEPIDVGSDNLNVTVRIPACTASVSGRMSGEPRTWFALWRGDNRISAPVYSYSDEQGNYNVKNLPVGHYLLGDESFDPESVVLEFDLAAGENKTVDIDADKAARLANTLFCVLTADENNIPTDGAEIWLEKAGRKLWPVANYIGIAHFAAVADTTYMLNVRLAGYHQVIREVTIVAQSKERALDEPLIVRLEKQ